MYYILFYKTVDDYVERRAPFRSQHLEFAQNAHESGLIVMAGALAEPADSAVFVFKADNPELVHDFAQNDPYVKNGLITEWSVRPWTVVIGNE